MDTIKLILADTQYIIRQGFRSLISKETDIQLVAVATNQEKLLETVAKIKHDIIVIDFEQFEFTIEAIHKCREISPNTRYVALTNNKTKTNLVNAIDAGVNSYILKECSQDEFIDAIRLTAKGEKFFCGKLLDLLVDSNLEDSCVAVNLSNRETEIIKLIAEGYTYKEIAVQLFLSSHTVTTHRKNIMKKLELKNTAGIVRYAIKEQLVAAN
ncbi:MAG: response regulator transcription factor [Bacteroidetes bacterium]|nr:response regulator transcription factor [Bacteroidota bacterium]